MRRCIRRIRISSGPKPLYTAALVTGLVMLVLAACQKPEPAPASSTGGGAGSCSLELAADADDEAAIQAVLHAEGASVVSQDIDALMRLWAQDGKVSDAKNTPDNIEDDQTWDGKDAIRHRYVRTVFPGAPDSAQPSDLEITMNGDAATVTATTHIGEEISPAGDRWEFTRVDGCWLIQTLTYNLEANP